MLLHRVVGLCVVRMYALVGVGCASTLPIPNNTRLREETVESARVTATKMRIAVFVVGKTTTE